MTDTATAVRPAVRARKLPRSTGAAPAGASASVGYPLDRLLPGLVAKVGYQDLGEVDVTFSALSTTDDIANERPESGDGVTVSAAYRHALSDSVIAAGAASWGESCTDRR